MGGLRLSPVSVSYPRRVVRRVHVILAALCVAFTMVASSFASSQDYVTNGLLCIHRYEGSWSDPNSPYYGGLQMDVNFMKAYGRSYYNRWGTADHWPVWAQLQAGRNGYADVGWSPWPNTRRYCGL
jgi:hypothetical protein